MWKNYLTIALRNLLKYKGYTIINIVGLAVGIASGVLILLWVQDELSYDVFHDKADRIVRITQEENVVTPAMIGPTLKRELAEVENFVRFYDATRFGPYVIRHEDRLFQEDRFFYADSTAFSVFSFRLVAGDPATALTRPHTVVLTRSMAEKYFGERDPIGETLNINNEQQVEVTGVIEDVPHTSHLQFDFLGSYSSLGQAWAKNETTWDSANLLTYLLLQDEKSVKHFEESIAAFVERQLGAQLRTSGSTLTLPIQPLTRIHLHSKLHGEANGDITYVYGFSAIAILILLIACINYMNLATARSSRRAREVGMRKVMGAVRGQLSWQFFGESALIATLALILSLVLIHLFLPEFNALAGKQLELDYFGNPTILLGLIAIGLGVSLVSGIYPALLLSGFQPVVVLQKAISEKAGHAALRSRLVVFQFAISIGLIVATLVVSNQLDFVRGKNLGFDKEQILVLPIGDAVLQQNRGSLKHELRQHRDIVSVAAADGYPGNQLGGYRVQAEGLVPDDYPTAGGMAVDEDIVETLGMEMLSGRGFPKTYRPEQGYYFVINEVLLDLLGWQPDQALGKELNLHGRRGPIVGVARNFHFMSLHNPIYQLVMFLSPRPSDYDYLLVKMQSQDIKEVLAFVEETWKARAPHRPFEYAFLDQEFDALYRDEERVGQVFTVFSGLAMIIACLGLFGLASFTAEQRTKEIGVRKVLGASVPEILILLGKDFAKLLVIAFIFAAPLSYFAMDSWLQDFSYRIDIGMNTFLIAGFAVLAIALLTVSFQSVRAAMSNPVEALRYE